MADVKAYTIVDGGAAKALRDVAFEDKKFARPLPSLIRMAEGKATWTDGRILLQADAATEPGEPLTVKCLNLPRKKADYANGLAVEVNGAGPVAKLPGSTVNLPEADYRYPEVHRVMDSLPGDGAISLTLSVGVLEKLVKAAKATGSESVELKMDSDGESSVRKAMAVRIGHSLTGAVMPMAKGGA